MKIYLLFLILFISVCPLFPQTFDLKFTELQRNSSNYDVKIQIRGSAGFKLGISNITFNFNYLNLSTPVLLAAYNFSGSWYDVITVTNPGAGVCSINIVLNGINNGSIVNNSWSDIAAIRFPMTDPNGTSTFSFRTTDPNILDVFLDNNATLLTAGTLFDLGPVALPVELTTFSAVLDSKSIKLDWETATEVNNSGFNIERAKIQNSGDTILNYETIGFVKGSVSSISPKHYSFSDNTIISMKRYFYRLKQIDYDGTFIYSKSIEINTANEIKGYLLNQNYPNPFNPSTLISYELPENCSVNLKVFDILGNEVTTLVNEYKAAGVYNVYFNPVDHNNKNIVSGIYIYRISAGKFNSSRKMIFLK